MGERERGGVAPFDAAAARLLATPPPAVSAAAAEAALLECYGLRGRAAALAAERDRNFMVTLDDGSRRVLKVYHEADDAETRAFQHGALVHMERVGCACVVPRLIRTLRGGDDCGIEAGGRPYRAILIDVVPGGPGDLGAASPALRRGLGRAAAEVGTALAGYRHPAAHRVLLWDAMQVGRLAPVADAVPDPALRHWLRGLLDRFAATVRPRAERLPAQVIHNDMSGSNVFVRDGAVSGVIDFGDMVWAPRVNEIAVLATYCMGHDPLAAIADVVEGYETLRGLDEAEVDLLYDLVSARLALRVLMYRWRAELFPDNRDYILRHSVAGHRLAEAFAAHPPGAGRDGVLKPWWQRRRGA